MFLTLPGWNGKKRKEKKIELNYTDAFEQHCRYLYVRVLTNNNIINSTGQ